MSLITCRVCGRVEYLFRGQHYCSKHSTHKDRLRVYRQRRKNERT
jgi:ribosomal protein L37E